MLAVMGATGVALVVGCQADGATPPLIKGGPAPVDTVPTIPVVDPTFAWLASRIMARHGVAPFGYIRSEGLTQSSGKLVSWAPFAGSSITLGTITAAALGAATPQVD